MSCKTREENEEFASHYLRAFGASPKLSDPHVLSKSLVVTKIILPRRHLTEDASSLCRTGFQRSFGKTIFFIPLHYQPCFSTLLM